MTAVGIVNVGLAALSALLALTLAVVYWRNHREIRSPFTLGLLLFSAFLVFHNATFIYHTFTMMDAGTVADETIMLIEGALQVAAVGALLYATMR